MADVEIPEAWQLDSGLREDMVLTIHSCYFAPHAEYQEGKQLMIWLIGTDENDEPAETRMSVGADWQSADGGVTITHPTKRKQHINKNSIYGHFISYCFEIPELAKTLVSRGAPTDSRIWMGLILHLQNREITFGKNIDPQERLMPTEFMGLYTDQAPATVSPMAAQPAPAAAPAPTVSSAPVITMEAQQAAMSPQELVAQAKARAQQEAAVTNGSPLYMRAVELAKSLPDYATFMTAALNDAEILSDEELAERCADPQGIWAEAHSS
jgi:hypothetical protein